MIIKKKFFFNQIFDIQNVMQQAGIYNSANVEKIEIIKIDNTEFLLIAEII